MKILCAVQRYHPALGGSELYTKRIVEFLSLRNEVSVFTSTLNDIKGLWNKNIQKIEQNEKTSYLIKRYDFLTTEEIPRFVTDEFSSLMTNYPGPCILKLWEDLVLSKIDYDLIFATAFPFDHIIPAYIASKKWEIPIIVAPLIHQDFPELYLTGMRLTMLNNADAIVALTSSEKKILEDYGIDSRKIYILPPGVEQPNSKTNEQEFRNSQSISLNTKIVLFVGSKSIVKGIINLIEAMQIIWKTESNVMLVIIGPSTQEFDDYYSSLNSDTKNKILDLGIVDENLKNQVYDSCDIFALPSKSESFGMVYLEAWSHSKPVIGCRMKPITELIEDKKDGILVNFGNIDELVKALVSYLNDESLRNNYGKTGKEKSKTFNWDFTCSEFEKLCNLTQTSFTKKH